jgi:ABC-type sugar transport system permease subunit
MFVAVIISKVVNPRLASFYRVVAYMPVVLPVSVTMMMWRQIYNPHYGYLNHILQTLFHIKNPPQWTGDARWSMYVVLIADLWKNFGYYTLLFLMGIYNIDPTLYEAGAIDGAGGWAQFWHITLPLLKPIITLVLVLTGGIASATVSIMTMYDTNGGPAESVLTIGLYAYRTAFVLGDMRMGYAASMSLVMGLISAAFTGLIFKFLRTERA